MALAVALAAAAGTAAALRAAPDAGLPPCDDCSLVLIVIDTLRADHLGYHGYARDTSPALDAFSRRSRTYTRCMAQATWTVPSMASLLTSTYPFNHRLQFGPGDTESWHGLGDELHPLPEVLRDAGFETAALIGNPVLRARLGFDRGFDRYEHLSDDAIVREAVRQMARWDGRRSLLYLHLLGPHPGLDPPVPFDTLFGPAAGPLPEGGLSYQHVRQQTGGARAAYERWYRDLYDGDLRYTDKLVGDLLAYLDVSGALDHTIVVVTADHGEHLFDHGLLGHGTSVFEPLTHVPLLIRVPGDAPRRVDTVVEQVDLAPTLLASLGVPVSPAWHWDGDALGGDPAAFCEQGPRQAVRRGDDKLIADRSSGQATLYDLAEDPGETLDRGPLEPGVLKEMLGLLARWRDTRQDRVTPRAMTLDEEDLARLRALGYVE